MSREESVVSSPIFIIGNPRSGTTLLRLMLTCHPEIFVPPEGGFLIGLFDQYGDYTGERNRLASFAADVVTCRKMEFWDLNPDELAEYLLREQPQNYADLISGVYMFYGNEHQPGKKRWGDKNNFYLRHIPLMANLFPQAQFLHIVRDGRDVACSYRDLSELSAKSQLSKKYAPSLPNSVLGAARQWSTNLSTIRASFEEIGWQRVHEFRYEDLVNHAEDTLRHLCNFLKISYSPKMLDFAQENRKKELEPRAFDTWKSKNREQLTSARAQRWHNDMFEEDIVLFEQQAGIMLQEYGYSRTFTKKSTLMHLIGVTYRFISVGLGSAALVKRGLSAIKKKIT